MPGPELGAKDQKSVNEKEICMMPIYLPCEDKQ